MTRFDGTAVSRDVLAAMTTTLRHRGPDDEGTWFGGDIAFGHRRLSIIDVAGSHQPMQSADDRWVIAFNGEIFNYRELRAHLDYPFHTDGDTETILAGLTVHGIAFVSQLVGQFAFAAFDRRDGTLHLVRDRLGVLPLYYWRAGAELLFASEIKAILAGMPHRPSVDHQSLDAYLYGRSVPAPFTLFEGVRKLEAGHRVEIDRSGAERSVRYWTPPDEQPWEGGAPAAVDAVDAAVTEAVRSALVADVPVGAYLSGGVDSSLIVAKASALHTGGPLKTFSAGFGDPRHDELPWARMMSEHVGSDHHEIRVDAADFEALWPMLTWHRDAPMSEPADFAVYRLAQAAREHVTVVLSGEGGDELFAGYPKYKVARAMAAASILPGRFRQGVGERLDAHLPSSLARLRIAMRAWAAPNREDQYRTWFAPFSARERRELLAGLPSRTTSTEAGARDDAIRAMLLADLRSWLPDNLLERGDRMSMAASLELRPPLLDHRLAELAFRLPSNVKVRSGQTKWVLKEVARRHVPAQIVDRPKVGFRVPLAAWFRTSLRDTVRDRLTGSGSFVAQTFDKGAIERMLDRHSSGRFNEEIRIWTLMSLEVWHETFFSAVPEGACESA